MKVKVNTDWSDCYDTDEIVCPYCGHRFSDSWDYGDGEDIGKIECEACNREFNAERNYTITYTTYIPTDDDENEEYWKHGDVFDDGITTLEDEQRANQYGENSCEIQEDV